MKVQYHFSQSPIAVNSATSLDVLLSFQELEKTQQNSRRPLNLSLVLDESK